MQFGRPQSVAAYALSDSFRIAQQLTVFRRISMDSRTAFSARSCKVTAQLTPRLTVAQIPTLRQQRAAVEKALSEKCSHREDETWFFSKPGLDGIAFKSSRTDPEDVVVWRQPDEYW